MIDTQETNLPLEKEIEFEETGKLETSQTPVDTSAEITIETESNPEETVSVSEVKPDDTISVMEEKPEDIVSESKAEPDIVEPDIVEPDEAVLEVDSVPEISLSEVESDFEEVVAEPEKEAVVPEAEIEPETVESVADIDLVEDELSKLEDEPVVSEDELIALEDEKVVSEDELIALEDEPEVSEDELIALEDEPELEASEDKVEETVLEEKEADDSAESDSITRHDIILRLRSINENPKKYSRNEVDSLKQTFYRIRRAEIEAKKIEFLEAGGDEKDFTVPEDETETQFRSLIAEYKEKRNILTADEERQKETNLIIKQHLIERLKILTESQDDFNKRYNEFRDIQRKWKEIKLIPQEYSRELWRNYQLYNERFYDIVKINNQFREYDFKKNLEMKTVLCETVERLAKEKDAVSAFHQVQKLHQQWREIGPVSKAHRESIWERFKAASVAISRKQQAYYEDIRIRDEKNLEQKEAICKELEAIDTSTLKTMRDWEQKTEEVMALQKKWHSTGLSNRRQNNKLFDRFRTASNTYFNKKSEFYKIIKNETDKNLELKKALVEKAESLKISDDWKKTSKAFIELQNEWKKIGPVGRKHSDAIWKQFIEACDYFFERKNKESNSQKKSEEHENFEAKKALIEKIKTIDKRLTDDEALTLLRGYVTEWNTIGYVPFKEKDKLHKTFREVIDKQFDRLKVNDRDRRGQQFRSNQPETTGGGKNKLYNERDRLMRTFDKMKIELQTYENNIGFISSKGGGGLLKEIDRKIVRIKEDMEVIVKKIEAIDENLD